MRLFVTDCLSDRHGSNCGINAQRLIYQTQYYTYNSPDRSTLRRHADMILSGSREGVLIGQNRKDVQERARAVI
ncbi:MAG: hypothetical protein PUP92_23160 [Rhizonema sp. PD38]|nr:hypothetical protein [Rhizonema sp. PD38]